MKQYVFDFAHDIVKTDRENPLMRDDIKERRRQWINGVLEDYRNGIFTTAETLYLIADYVR